VDGGGGFDFALPEYDFSILDGIKSKADEIVDSIKNAFGNINFDPLITSFGNLLKAIQPFTTTLFSGLKWFWDNILVPFGKWSIEQLIPAFFNALAGAFTLLNPILEAFMALGIWLWESFLQPIASWGGSLIVDTLNGVGIALTAIGEWASANQEIINAMVTSFAIFFGLWKLTELMAFIQMSGGLVGAFVAITTAVKALTIAKLADKAETIILTALYAKDFLMSLVNGTAALIKQAAQWLIVTGLKIADAIQTGIATVAQIAWNIAAGIGAAVTTALAAAFAFLTSPIGLVVLAIAAVIAIGVLLWKNWDTIKEFAAKLGEKMMEIFRKNWRLYKWYF